MYAMKMVVISISTFLIYHIIFSNFFEVDVETNTLLAPDWYPIVGILLSIAISYLLGYKIPKRRKEKFYRKDIERSFKPDPNFIVTDAIIEQSKKVILDTGVAAVSMLERRMGFTYWQASRVMDRLEKEGFVAPFDGKNPRKIIFRKKDAGMHRSSIYEIDFMDGHEFEYWCADLLRKNGYENVEVTPGSGDQGIDVLAEKDGVKYAIQCKCYSKDLGNTPVQEAEAGRVFYDCHIGVVMTNRYFTKGAKELAEKTKTILWDRDKLEEMLEN